MSNLESKFQGLHIHVGNVIANLRRETNTEFASIHEQFDMHDSNISNLHQQLQEHMQDFEITILDIKEVLVGGDFDPSSSKLFRGSFEEMRKMKEEISRIKRNQTKKSEPNDISAYHKCTMVIGGLQGFEDQFSSKDWIQTKMMQSDLVMPEKIECRDDLIGILFCTFASEDLRDTAWNKMRVSEIDTVLKSRVLKSRVLKSRVLEDLRWPLWLVLFFFVYCCNPPIQVKTYVLGEAFL
eukprot:6977908-Karenia_brevis.AAC.1